MKKTYLMIGSIKKFLGVFLVLLVGVRCVPAPTLPPSSPQVTAISTDITAQPSPTQDPTVTPVPATPTTVVSFPPTSMQWQDQIVYVLTPHKFYDGDTTNNYMRDEYDLPNPDYEGGFLGGDIAGIRKQIPYLKSLGITSVLLNPVLSNNEKPFFQYLPTGYSVRDYQTIDRNFGTNEEFIRMVEEFHATTNGSRINIMLDLPISTTSGEHPWTRRNPSFYRPWNYQNPEDNIGCSPDYCEPYLLPDGTGVDQTFAMPILDHTAGMEIGTGAYAAVRDTIFWLVDHFDIDGILYVAAHNFDATFWVKFLGEFRDRYGETKPDFWHVADVFIWPGTETSWQVPSEEFVNETSSVGPIRMDGIYDWVLLVFIQEVFAKGTDPNCIPFFCANLLEHLVNPESVDHPERLIASVDGFDSFRRAVQNGNEKEKLYLASTFLLTINRVPLINSGNEYALDYTQPGELFVNGLDQTYHENFKELIQIRRGNAAFQRGSLTPLDTTATILSYARQYEDQTFIVVLNNAAVRQPFTIDLGSRGLPCSSVTNLLVENDQTIQLDNPGTDDTSLKVTLNAWEPKIIQCE